VKIPIIFILLFTFILSSYADEIGPWSLKPLFKTPQWHKTDKFAENGVQALLYSALPYKGKAVEIYAYYAAPKGTPPKGGWPAVVCVHGGGGTAFSTWVKKWNEHGYAAISMDLEGHYPQGENGSRHHLQRFTVENPGPKRIGVFNDYELPIQDQWYFHAVAQIILAHSLIRSFPEVNADKTGITGASWGGNLTSTTMGVDNRFKFAIPVYGCGFLAGSDGNQGQLIKPGKHAETVSKYFDGKAYFKNVTMPVLWMNGTNDHHFTMPITQKSSQAIKGKSTLRFAFEMKHGHGPGWNPEEPYVFADSVIKGKQPLTRVFNLKQAAGNLSVDYQGKDLQAAKIYYTEDTVSWPKRKWQAQIVNVTPNTLKVQLPIGAVAAYFELTDKRNLTVSSEFILVKNK
jgi:dienelactone hydrolase